MLEKEFLRQRNSLDLRKIERLVEDNDLIDIVVFGSFIRGERYRDIDVCVIGHTKTPEERIEIVKDLSNILGERFHVTYSSLESLFEGEPIWRAIFHEGYSVLRNSPISELLGMRSVVIFSYSLEGLSASEKVRLTYTLKGRKSGEGLVEKYGGVYLGRGVIMVPVEHSDSFREVFDLWNVKYDEKTCFTLSEL